MKHKTKTIFVIGLGTAIIGGFVLFILSLPKDAYAYSPHITHAPLMGKSADLYNKFYSENPLSAQEKEWLMQGAAGEDNPLSRAMYHFYDPINNSGITGYESSKWWAHNGAAQSAIAWPPGTDGDYSWEEALAAYERGDKEKAYVALGHVIHLVQDAGVPAHTRNDPHPGLHEKIHGGADPFEQEVKPFQPPDIAGLSPVVYGNIDNYFDNVALYSNTGFYSKNSVGFYEKPIPIRMDGKYVYGRDGKEEYRLLRIGDVFWDYNNDSPIKYILDDPLVLQDYWNRLAPTTIENGAGIIKLFKDTAKEEVIIKEEKLSFWDNAMGFLSNIYGSTKNTAYSITKWVAQFGGFSASSVQTELNEECGELAPYFMTSPGACTNTSISLSSSQENNQAQQNFYSQLQNIATVGGTVPPTVADDTGSETATEPKGAGSDPAPLEEEVSAETDTENTTDTTNTSDKSDSSKNEDPVETENEGEVLGDSTENDTATASTGFGPYGPTGPNQTFVKQQNTVPQNLGHLVINEIQIADSEFVELYNPTDTSVDLSSYYLAYYSSTRQNWKDDPEDGVDPDGPVSNKQFPEDAQILASGYYLIGLKDFSETQNMPEPDWEPTFTSLSNTKGTVAIFSENPKEAENPEPIDAVAWGSDDDVTLKETQTAPAPETGKSISRDADHTDTDDNFVNFTEQDPTPVNASGEELSVPPPVDIGNWDMDWEVTVEVDGEDVVLPVGTYYLEGQLTKISAFLNISNATDYNTNTIYGGGTYGPFGEMATFPAGSLLSKSCDGTICSINYSLSAFDVAVINSQPDGTDIWVCVTSMAQNSAQAWDDFYTANGAQPTGFAYKCKHIVKGI